MLVVGTIFSVTNVTASLMSLGRFQVVDLNLPIMRFQLARLQWYIVLLSALVGISRSLVRFRWPPQCGRWVTKPWYRPMSRSRSASPRVSSVTSWSRPLVSQNPHVALPAASILTDFSHSTSCALWCWCLVPRLGVFLLGGSGVCRTQPTLLPSLCILVEGLIWPPKDKSLLE